METHFEGKEKNYLTQNIIFLPYLHLSNAHYTFFFLSGGNRNLFTSGIIIWFSSADLGFVFWGLVRRATVQVFWA